MTTHKSDVWSAGVAMMNVLIGKTIDSEIQEKVYYLLGMGDIKKFMSRYIMTEIIMIIDIITV